MPLIQESLAYQRGGTQKDAYGPDEVVTVPCPLCGGEERTRLYTEHGSIGICRCRGCGLLYASPRLKEPERVYWGDAAAYEEEARLIFEGKAAHHRDPNYLEELALIKRHQPAGRFLDVGCNMGMLLRHVRRMGWEAVGVEPSPSLAKLAAERFGLRVYNCFLHELPAEEEGRFDVIALSDVLEHICEPRPFLAQAKRFLAPTGVLYVKVPNGRWNLFKQQALGLLGRRPAQGIWDSYEHVVHYTQETLTRMLRQAGFEPFRVTIGRPVQVPVWERYVGRYYLYPSPWTLDWPRHAGRLAFYWMAWAERVARLGSIGSFAPDLVALARPTPQTTEPSS
jgi:2-polyprenyl-3-methyl-5-hydroxy-6-metoxy-1,4-benzoquinol methylase